MSFKLAQEPYAVIPMNGDGSCFYHCLHHCLEGNEEYNALIVAAEEQLRNDLIDDDEEEYLNNPDQYIFDHVTALRYLIASYATEADYEAYKILCIAEAENPKHETFSDFMLSIADRLEYVNEVVINIVLRVLNEKLGGRTFGIYILKDDLVVSPPEWGNKDLNIVLKFVNENHYDVIHVDETLPLIVLNRDLKVFQRC